MFKPKLIRLIIYLVISLGLLIFLFNIPTESVPKKQEKNSSVQEIEVTEKEKLGTEDAFEIQIDSLNQYIHSNKVIELDELSNEIIVQKDKRPKLFLKINVHPHSKSNLLMELIEFARKEKLKVGIIKD